MNAGMVGRLMLVEIPHRKGGKDFLNHFISFQNYKIALADFFKHGKTIKN